MIIYNNASFIDYLIPTSIANYPSQTLLTSCDRDMNVCTHQKIVLSGIITSTNKDSDVILSNLLTFLKFRYYAYFIQ